MATIISGKVKKHLGRGKQLGFPTANLDAETHAEEGVYVGLVTHIENGLPPLFVRKLWPRKAIMPEQKYLPALIFIGSAKTFDEQERKVEVYILDFTYDIYGKELGVELIKKIRENEKFDSADELIEQMKQDELFARQFFSSYNPSN
ncbi:MAG: riboflavin kinase [Candidatus Doudnabacteria bacterium]|nr:riboflavin kinase [Candidatus Doudnabacteria bacterium]